MRYNWQQNDWPEFRYDLTSIEPKLHEISLKMGRLSGLVDALPDTVQTEAIIDMMVIEAIKTSEIEGEYLSRQDVMSSIRNNLGLHSEQEVGDDRAKGAASLMLAVRNDYKSPLTKNMLFDWHEMLMQGSNRLLIGAWRTHEEPMQVVSGMIGKEKIHFEAPPSNSVAQEMDGFVAWYNAKHKISAVHSALSHLYFESIHPFEDGNGRIGRAISEKALLQGLDHPALFSLSQAIESDKKAYYNALQAAQKTNETTIWLEYFIDLILKAQRQAENQIDFVLKKVKFFDHFDSLLNDRQRRVVARMFEKYQENDNQGMSATRYSKVTDTSKATATRDLQDLVQKKVLIFEGAGRSTKYYLNI